MKKEQLKKIEKEIIVEGNKAEEFIRSKYWKWFRKKLEFLSDTDIFLSTKPEKLHAVQIKMRTIKDIMYIPEQCIAERDVLLKEKA